MSIDNDLYYFQGLSEDELPCSTCKEPRWNCKCPSASSPSVAKGEPTTIADAINLYGTKPAAQPGTMTAREPQEPDPDYPFVEQNTFDADDPEPWRPNVRPSR